MTFSLLRPSVRAALLATLVPALPSAALSLNVADTVNLAVPDGSASGLVRSLFIPAGPGKITDLNVTLELAGDPYGWNGDLYVLLSHGGQSSVLINRPGKTASSSFGYDDAGGLNVTFDDSAVTDFHAYRDALAAPLGLTDPVTGTFQPDARRADPDDVTDTSDRDGFLDAFNEQSPSGEWLIQVVDLSPGGALRLINWSLDFTLSTALPDRGSTLLMLGGVGGLLALGSRRRRTV